MIKSAAMTPAPPEGPAPRNNVQLLSCMEALAPWLDGATLARAVQRVPPDDPLPVGLEKVGAALGLALFEVDASAEELVRAGARFPAIRLDPEPRIVRRVGRRGAELASPTAGLHVEFEPAHKRARHLLVSRSLQLRMLGHRHGLRRLIAYLREERSLIRKIILFAVGVEILSLAVPLTVQVLINTIGFGMLQQPLLVLSALLLLSLSGAAAFRLLQTLAVEHLARRFTQRVTLDLAERLYRLKAHVGQPEVPSHRFFEIVSVDKALFVLGLDLIGLVLQFAAATILLSVYHPILLSFAVALTFSAWAAIRIPFGPGFSRSLEESTAKYALGAWLSAHPMGFDLEGRARLTSWLIARERGFRVTFGQQAALFAVQVVFSAGLLLLGGRLVVEGQLTLGQLVAAELVTTTALVSLGKWGKQLPKIYDLITSFEKLGKLVDLPLDSESNPPKDEAA